MKTRIELCKDYIIYLAKMGRTIEEISDLLDSSDFSSDEILQANMKLVDEEQKELFIRIIFLGLEVITNETT